MARSDCASCHAPLPEHHDEHPVLMPEHVDRCCDCADRAVAGSDLSWERFADELDEVVDRVEAGELPASALDRYLLGCGGPR